MDWATEIIDIAEKDKQTIAKQLRKSVEKSRKAQIEARPQCDTLYRFE